jgi:hypothetical protein
MRTGAHSLPARDGRGTFEIASDHVSRAGEMSMVKLLIGASLVFGGWLTTEVRPAARAASPVVRVNGEVNDAPRQQGICCCQTFSQRWQYSWTTPAACAQSRGSCVSPDHCG